MSVIDKSHPLYDGLWRCSSCHGLIDGPKVFWSLWHPWGGNGKVPEDEAVELGFHPECAVLFGAHVASDGLKADGKGHYNLGHGPGMHRRYET